MTARIYTVPAGRPFLDRLATAILRGDLPAAHGKAPQPLEIPDITLVLPTARATRAVQEAFLRAAGGRAMLLPKIMAISEGQEELSLISGLAGEGGAAGDIPPAMNEMERRLALASLVIAWSAAQRRTGESATASGASTPAQAATLAVELARFMDMIETEDKSLEGLARLVPATFSEHWQHTLKFLEIVTAHWPAHLKERGLLSTAARRNAVILAEAKRLEASPPAAPVIVAGVTGSIPATVEFMRTVASLRNGAIVLPGLDTDLDEESWKQVSEHPEHPQFGLRKLLDSLGVARGDVGILVGAEADPARAARAGFVAEAMRPSGTTGRWQIFAADMRKRGTSSTLEGVSLIEAASPQDEAEAIALILREAAETPGRTAALVSPDRLLARRVAVRLEAWGIKVDDSAGRPFIKTVPGAFLDLVVETAAQNFAPAPLMALLKHPLARLGLDPFAVRRAARALEIAAFRTAYLGDGIPGIEAALERAKHETDTGARRGVAVRRLWPDDWTAARDLVQRLASAYAPLVAAYRQPAAATLQSFAAAHLKAAEALASVPQVAEGDGEPQAMPLWENEGGETARQLFAQLIDETLPLLEITASDYADLYRSLVRTETVRPRHPVHPRLFIWGPFEARLQQTDIVILGSLNEGTWPDAADPGPWLNRPMRSALGLPSPEEKIGLSAHDFVSLLGTPEVVLTRAEKRDGVPTVPSRWLLRLKALLNGTGADAALTPKAHWDAWARLRDRADRIAPLKAPEPRPPLAQRPRKLSVSRVEAWIANPYAIFAGRILRLERLDPLGQEPGPALRGSIIHDALSRFSRAHPEHLPGDIKGELVRFARTALDAYRAHPRIAAFWLPRFERFADWFADTEPARRAGTSKIIAETTGSLVFKAPGGPFTLTARADRIDAGALGLVITDYKTGQPPTDTRVTDLLAPQLPLEAAIALAAGEDAGFAHAPKLPVARLRYIRASGGEPPGEERDVACEDPGVLAGAALAGLKRQVALFDDPDTPYTALRRARFDYKYDEFAHLARVAEWSAAADTSEDD